MTRGWWGKLILLLALVGTAVVYVYPTLSGLDPATSKFPFKQKVNLGLDLQGGLYLVLGVDFNKVFKDVTERQKTSLEARLKDKGIAHKASKMLPLDSAQADDPKFRVEFDPASRNAVHELIKAEYWSLRLAGEEAGFFDLGLSREYRTEIRDRTLSQSIEVIRNRIDEFGVAEPAITSQGSDRVVVELPGVKEIERAKSLIGQTAKLEFKIVNDEAMDPTKLAELVASLEKASGGPLKDGEKFSAYAARINQAAKGKIPEGNEISFERANARAAAQDGEAPSAAGGSTVWIPYLLHSKVEVTGEDLADANVQIDPQNQRPNVAFSLNPRGATAFDKVTGESINKRLAIVLDNIVHSAPVIQGRIGGGHGQITLGRGQGDQLMKEARDLAIVLRAGALPAQLDFLEQRVVGPSLGQDSIAKGAKAGIVGCLAIFLFMSVYYRMSGVVASVSLLFNATFILAVLVGMEATLTLPGIAGIALTIGMAVDSNVLIFERIRDELNEGKSVAGAVEAGFGKAFTAIFDANITHGIVAFILMTYGTGPIRGFAVSLLIGIITTLFCAVTVCKLFFEGYVAAKGAKLTKLSI